MITEETALISMTHFHFDNQKIIDVLKFKFRKLDETLDWVSSELKKPIHFNFLFFNRITKFATRKSCGSKKDN